MFSNNFPCSLYSHNMSLPASPEPFLRGGHRAGSNSFPFTLLSLAIAQNILPGIFSLKLNVLWISFLCFLGKIPSLPALFIVV